MTTVQDTIYNASGALANGRLIIDSPPFTMNGVAVAASQTEADIVNGALNVQLFANMTAQPTGVYYTARYELDQGPVFEEYWVIPNQPAVNLGQVRVTFPATPSVMINAQQLTSAGALPGQFLGWNGANWVPMYVSTFNYYPNFTGLNLSANPGADLSVSGSPATLGSSFSLNVPDAGPASRGVVNTGAQTFAGDKTFANNVIVNGLLTGGSAVLNSLSVANLQVTGSTNLLVDPTTTLGDLIVRSSTAPKRFGLGATGQVLSVDTTQPLGLRWVTPTGAVSSVFGRTGAVIAQAGDYTVSQITGALADPTTTKGDLLARGVSAIGRLPVGSDGQVLLADSTQSLGVRWAAASSVGPVSSVFGRAGAVVAQTGDYTAAQVTNAVDQTGSYVNPAWIVSLPWSKITGAPATGVSSVFGRAGVVVAQAGDYTAAQVTNAVSTVGSYSDPSWITSLSWSKITGAPAGGVSSVFGRTGAVVAQPGDYNVGQITGAVPNTLQIIAGTGLSGGGSLLGNVTLSVQPQSTVQLVNVSVDGSAVGTVSTVNLIAGSNMTISGALSGGVVNVTFASSAGGGGGAVSSVFSRTGAVLAQTGDYTAAQVTNAVDSTQSYSNPAWIAALSWSKITGAPAIYADPLTTTGDVLYRASSSTTRLGIGSAGQVLTVVSGLPVWATPATAPVTSVFSRTGAVVAAAGDYSAYYVSLTGSYASPAWLTQINWSIVTGAPAFLVSPLTTKGDIIAYSTSAVRVGVGANNTILMADSTQTPGVKWGTPTAAMITNAVDSTGSYSNPSWITALAWSKLTSVPAMVNTISPGTLSGAVTLAGGANISVTQSSQTITIAATGLYADPLTTTGDVLYRSATATSRLAIGSAGQVLTVSGGLPVWSTPATAPVTSVFTRTGAIVAAAGDYSAFYPLLTGSYSDPAWITGLSWSKILSAPAFMTDPTTTTGDIIYRSSTGTTRLGIGSSGQVLTVVSGVPAWAAATGGGGYWVGGSGGVIYYNGGNVGIGTTSPGNKLSIVGDIFLSDVTNDNAINITPYAYTAGAAINVRNSSWSTAKALILNAGGGNVGIGTTSPSYSLDVRGGSFLLANSDWASGVGSGILTYFGATSGNTYSVLQAFSSGGGGGGNLVFNPNGSYVGIGVTDPRTSLTIINPNQPTAVGQEQLVIGENSDNHGYGLSIGYDFLSSVWTGVIQALPAGSVALALNPIGGNVGVGTPFPNATLHVKPGGSADSTGQPSGPWAAIIYNATNAANYNGLLVKNNWGAANSTILQAGNDVVGGAFKSFFLVNGLGNVGVNTTSPGPLGGATGFQLTQVTQLNGVLSIGGSGDGDIQIGTWGYVSCNNQDGGFAIGQNLIYRQNPGVSNYWVSPVTHGSIGFCGIQFYGGAVVLFTGGSVATTGGGTVTPTEKFRLASNGNIGLQLLSPSYPLHLGFDNAAKSSTSTWLISSDARVKRNVRDLSGGIDVINRLRAIEAEYNGLAQTPVGGRAVGFIAQEVEKVLPQCVTRDDNGILGLNIHEILIHLVLAVQQLSKKVS